MTQPNTQTSTQTPHKPESAMKHIVSFAVMILLTIGSFVLVAMKIVPLAWVLPLMIGFAVIQVFLQLFTFMHLDQKGSFYFTFFILTGAFVAIYSALGIILMP